MCVSLPSLRPLLAWLFPTLFKSQWTTRGAVSGTAKSSASSHRRPGGPPSKLSIGGRGGDDAPIELVQASPRPRRDSWVMLPDPEAQLDTVWERGAREPPAAGRPEGKKKKRVSAWDHD